MRNLWDIHGRRYVRDHEGWCTSAYVYFKPDGPGTDQAFPVILQRTCYPAQDALSKLHGHVLQNGGTFLYISTAEALSSLKGRGCQT